MTSRFSSPTKFLRISISDTDLHFTVLKFDGTDGVAERFSGNSNLPPLCHAEIFIHENENQIIWNGPIEAKLEAGSLQFSLCVQSIQQTSQQSLIRWSEVPRLLSVFDGGYEALSKGTVGTLLDDIITFHQEVRARIHFDINGMTTSVNGSLGDQESLKELNEILFDWHNDSVLPVSNQVVVLEIELFEVVYFIIGLAADSDAQGAVIGLTDHFYRQAQRVGRRIPVSEISFCDFKVIEVSDFGMKAIFTGKEILEANSIVPLPISESDSLNFCIVYATESAIGTTVGLYLHDDSPRVREIWQDFLLPHQYPLLRRRSKADHQAVWKLLEDSGYLSGTQGEFIAQFKTAILNEWERIDQAGPSSGRTVVGFDQEKAVSTIGVSRVTDSAWTAQAAAAINDPKYIALTKSMYSWRTRYIIQQRDGKYHLAFFERDKPFLDRFFRKFYLQNGGKNTPLISWTEWKLYAHQPKEPIIPAHPQSPRPQLPLSFDRNELLLEVLAKDTTKSLQLVPLQSGVFVYTHPHLHMWQYFTSIFIDKQDSTVFTDMPVQPKDSFYTIRSREENDLVAIRSLESQGPVLDLGWDVVWVCHRTLLSQFLSNSLKSLEIMVRKYGGKSAA